MVRLAAIAVGLVLSTPPLYAQETLFTVTVTFANIHAGPSTDSWIITAAQPGKSFEVKRELGRWVAIEWPAAKDGVGYLHSSWGTFSRRVAADVPLTISPPASIEAEAQPAVAAPDATAPDTEGTAPSGVPGTGVTAPPVVPDVEVSAPSTVSDIGVSAPVPDIGVSAPPSSTVRTEESPVAEPSSPGVIPSSDGTRPPGYSVQVAAVRDMEEARSLSDKLTGAGYSVFLTTATVKQVRFHRVRVGPFETRQTAQQVAKQLETQGYKAPWITK